MKAYVSKYLLGSGPPQVKTPRRSERIRLIERQGFNEWTGLPEVRSVAPESGLSFAPCCPRMREFKESVIAGRPSSAPFSGAPFFKGFALGNPPKESPVLVKQIMSQPVVSCQVDDDANIAAQRMWENDCGVIPVLNEEGRVIAMLTDRDICMAAYTQGKLLAQILVSSMMSKILFSCRPEDTLDHAERLMREYQVRRLPVVDQENRPVGILSINDVACASAQRPSLDPTDSDGISNSSTARTLAAICAHRIAESHVKLA